jgi:DNA replication protein DnaC
MDLLATVPLLIIDDLGMRKLPLIAAEELLEIIMRRYERARLLIPVMWARDYGDVGQSWSEATLVVSYISYVAHMSQEKGK